MNPKLGIGRFLINSIFVLFILCSLVGFGILYFRSIYPHGVRPCFFSCTVQALETYAASNGGKYPTGKSPAVRNLTELYPSYINAEPLAGLSGASHKIRAILERGSDEIEGVSSWEYVPGLTLESKREKALIWERSSGLASNGKRLPNGGRWVGFVGGHTKFIEESMWTEFIAAQSQLKSDPW